MKIRVSSILALVATLVSVVTILSARGWPLKAALFPFVIGVPLLVLSLWELALSLLAEDGQAQAVDFQISKEVDVRTRRRRTLSILGWALGYFVAILFAGFPVSTFLFVFLYLKFEAGEGWLMTIALTVFAGLFFYGLFDRLLHLPFPEGWLLSL
jgi:hypothetical protein